MKTALVFILAFVAFSVCHPGIDESYPYSDFFYACIGGRFFDGLGFVSSIHPVSECIAKCRGLSQMYSILTYVPNKKDVASTCCLGCSCADFETLEETSVLEPSSYCNTNFTEGTSGVCWSSCYDSVYCSFGEKFANGDCPREKK